MDRPPSHWEPARNTEEAAPMPPAATMLWRGARGRCPVCGEGRVFEGYLRVARECGHCHAPLGRLRADDAPPYFTIFIVGHLLVPPVFWIEKAYQPPMWLHMTVWLPLFTIICILLLRPVKGAVVGWMLRMGILSDEMENPLEQSGTGQQVPPLPPRRNG